VVSCEVPLISSNCLTTRRNNGQDCITRYFLLISFPIEPVFTNEVGSLYEICPVTGVTTSFGVHLWDITVLEGKFILKEQTTAPSSAILKFPSITLLFYSSFNMYLPALLLLAISSIPSANARTCGTGPPSAGLHASHAKLYTLERAGRSNYQLNNIALETYIHIISSGETLEEGNVPDSQITAQVIPFLS